MHNIVVLKVCMLIAYILITSSCMLLTAGILGFSMGSFYISNVIYLEIASAKTLFLPLVWTKVIL